jgi:hypothetical protein
MECIALVVTAAATGSELMNGVMICKRWSGNDVEGIGCG